MMALYTNKMDVFDYATYWRIMIVLLKKNGAFYHPSFVVVLTVKGEIH